jgi:hypothetical protein
MKHAPWLNAAGATRTGDQSSTGHGRGKRDVELVGEECSSGNARDRNVAGLADAKQGRFACVLDIGSARGPHRADEEAQNNRPTRLHFRSQRIRNLNSEFSARRSSRWSTPQRTARQENVTVRNLSPEQHNRASSRHFKHYLRA